MRRRAGKHETMKDHAMTVGELIEKLQKYRSDARVLLHVKDKHMAGLEGLDAFSSEVGKEPSWVWLCGKVWICNR